jgi:hypothetical protein
VPNGRTAAFALAALLAVACGSPPADAAPESAIDAACPAGAVPVGSFADVAGIHAPAVDCLAWRGIAHGTGYAAFAPAAAVRRDQMATLLARTLQLAAIDLPAPTTPPFGDVEGVHAESVARLAAADVVSGVTPDRFEPQAPVRRDQMAALLVRAARVAGAPLPAGPDAFGDDDASVHEPAIDAARAAGLVAGAAPGRFAPDATVRRDQMATFLARLLALLTAQGLTEPPPAAAFTGVAMPLPAPVAAEMAGVSWRPGCPVSLDELALLAVSHHGMDGRVHRGELVVAGAVAADVLSALKAVFEAGFPIDRMRRVEAYGGSDERSMADNNTSAFNCRAVAGGSAWSEHAYGTAIDINPVQNPYVRGGGVAPAAGKAYLDRADLRPGMLVRPGPVVDAFAAIGWGWGGNWTSLKDYQHLSRSGR